MSQATSVLTPEFRLSFFDLYAAKADMNGKLGFRAELLFPKSITGPELRPMRLLHDQSIPPEWKAGGVVPRTFNQCFIDGDLKKQEGRKGHYMLRVSSGPDFAPRLLIETRATAKPGDLYCGCYARAILSTFTWEHKNPSGAVIKRGVSFNVLTVQRTRKPAADGSDRFGSFVTPEEQDALLDAAPLSVEEAEDLLA